jgi:hypothetical protein
MFIDLVRCRLLGTSPTLAGCLLSAALLAGAGCDPGMGPNAGLDLSYDRPTLELELRWTTEMDERYDGAREKDDAPGEEIETLNVDDHLVKAYPARWKQPDPP